MEYAIDFQWIDGLSYPFNKYRDYTRDFDPYVELPSGPNERRIRVFHYLTNVHYILRGSRFQNGNNDNLPIDTEVIIFCERTKFKNEIGFGNFHRKIVDQDPMRCTVENYTNGGLHYKLKNAPGAWGSWVCWQLESIRIGKGEIIHFHNDKV